MQRESDYCRLYSTVVPGLPGSLGGCVVLQCCAPGRPSGRNASECTLSGQRPPSHLKKELNHKIENKDLFKNGAF
jgi:hypothetical protein